MQMIEQNHDVIYLERALFPDHPESLSQEIDGLKQQFRTPVSKSHREEARAARKAVAAVIGHEKTYIASM